MLLHQCYWLVYKFNKERLANLFIYTCILIKVGKLVFSWESGTTAPELEGLVEKSSEPKSMVEESLESKDMVV